MWSDSPHIRENSIYKKVYASSYLFDPFDRRAVGNLIDRVRLNYVIDFFYFKLIDFPIFNVADCYVVVACIIFAFLILFYYKEDSDFDFLRKQKNRI